jgi:adenylylsulfate kinase
MTQVKCLDKGMVVWLTGLSGSGKTTIARTVTEKLRKEGYRVELLDGDWVRKTINPDAGFTREERRRHLHRVAWIARLLARNGVIVLCSFVSPYRDVRREIRRIISEEVPFYEIYVYATVDECIKRDPKGLYKKALKGEIPHFTGISDPYEPPEKPELVLDTMSHDINYNSSKLYEFILSKLDYEGEQV